MVKQKMVIKVSLNDKKSRSKALKIAVGVSGVESAGFQGEGKDQIEVTGDGVDAVGLTSLLRKSFCHAELVSVGPVDEKEEKKEEPTIQPTWWPCVATVPPYPICEIRSINQCQDPYCTIM